MQARSHIYSNLAISKVLSGVQCKCGFFVAMHTHWKWITCSHLAFTFHMKSNILCNCGIGCSIYSLNKFTMRKSKINIMNPNYWHTYIQMSCNIRIAKGYWLWVQFPDSNSDVYISFTCCTWSNVKVTATESTSNWNYYFQNPRNCVNDSRNGRNCGFWATVVVAHHSLTPCGTSRLMSMHFYIHFGASALTTTRWQTPHRFKVNPFIQQSTEVRKCKQDGRASETTHTYDTHPRSHTTLSAYLCADDSVNWILFAWL